MRSTTALTSTVPAGAKPGANEVASALGNACKTPSDNFLRVTTSPIPLLAPAGTVAVTGFFDIPPTESPLVDSKVSPTRPMSSPWSTPDWARSASPGQLHALPDRRRLHIRVRDRVHRAATTTPNARYAPLNHGKASGYAAGAAFPGDDLKHLPHRHPIPGQPSSIATPARPTRHSAPKSPPRRVEPVRRHRQRRRRRVPPQPLPLPLRGVW